MLTFEDCLALCELTEDEIDAIAEHEQISETVAVELGSYLIHGPDGQLLIQRMIIDDIQAARRRGAPQTALRRFMRHSGAAKTGSPCRVIPALFIAPALAPSASRSSSSGDAARNSRAMRLERSRPAAGAVATCSLIRILATKAVSLR